MDIVQQIEHVLGTDRVRQLKKNDDNYQIFWLGVLEHRKDVDCTRDPIPYLISCGYGAIRNEYLKSNTRDKMRVCPHCGRSYTYRYARCPKCGADSVTERRVFSSTLEDNSEMEFEDGRTTDVLLSIDIDFFISTLHGNEQYVARRWLKDRADLMYDNHLKQIALEMGCSAPYVARVKKSIRSKWQLFQR